MLIATADLCDSHGAAVQAAEPVFRDFGGRTSFFGPVVTLRVEDDNSLVRTALEEAGHGRVLVVDGRGSTRCALLGGNLAKLAQDNRWAGVVVHGCVRDSEELVATAVGVKALATHPRKSEKRGRGERDVALEFAGVRIESGSWVYCDADGLVVASEELR